MQILVKVLIWILAITSVFLRLLPSQVDAYPFIKKFLELRQGAATVARGGDVGSETTCDLSRKEVKSVFDSYSFQRGMTFIGHWAGFRRIKNQGEKINQYI